MNQDQRAQHGIFYGIVAIAIVGALAIVVLNLHTSDTALVVSQTSPVSDNQATTTPQQLFGTAPNRFVTVGDMIYELSTTTEQQEQGLGDRPYIPDNYGMIFVFSHADRYGFWMKDMEVPLDIIWLSDTGTVLGIEASLATSSYPAAVYPPQPVKFVLETKAGFMQAHGIRVGDTFPNLPNLSKISE
jgi:uncharacterized membrane protein (UPF0127 family)